MGFDSFFFSQKYNSDIFFLENSLPVRVMARCVDRKSVAAATFCRDYLLCRENVTCTNGRNKYLINCGACEYHRMDSAVKPSLF
jgi:hypothetical protein